MNGGADRDRVSTSGDSGRDGVGAGDDEGERAGPEGLRQARCAVAPPAGESDGLSFAGDVRDQRVGAGAPLRLVDPADGLGVERSRAEAVDRLRGERDEGPAPQDRHRFVDDRAATR